MSLDAFLASVGSPLASGSGDGPTKKLPADAVLQLLDARIAAAEPKKEAPQPVQSISPEVVAALQAYAKALSQYSRTATALSFAERFSPAVKAANEAHDAAHTADIAAAISAVAKATEMTDALATEMDYSLGRGWSFINGAAFSALKDRCHAIDDIIRQRVQHVWDHILSVSITDTTVTLSAGDAAALKYIWDTASKDEQDAHMKALAEQVLVIPNGSVQSDGEKLVLERGSTSSAPQVLAWIHAHVFLAVSGPPPAAGLSPAMQVSFSRHFVGPFIGKEKQRLREQIRSAHRPAVQLEETVRDAKAQAHDIHAMLIREGYIRAAARTAPSVKIAGWVLPEPRSDLEEWAEHLELSLGKDVTGDNLDQVRITVLRRDEAAWDIVHIDGIEVPGEEPEELFFGTQDMASALPVPALNPTLQPTRAQESEEAPAQASAPAPTPAPRARAKPTLGGVKIDAIPPKPAPASAAEPDTVTQDQAWGWDADDWDKENLAEHVWDMNDPTQPVAQEQAGNAWGHDTAEIVPAGTAPALDAELDTPLADTVQDPSDTIDEAWDWGDEEEGAPEEPHPTAQPPSDKDIAWDERPITVDWDIQHEEPDACPADDQQADTQPVEDTEDAWGEELQVKDWDDEPQEVDEWPMETFQDDNKQHPEPTEDDAFDTLEADEEPQAQYPQVAEWPTEQGIDAWDGNTPEAGAGTKELGALEQDQPHEAADAWGSRQDAWDFNVQEYEVQDKEPAPEQTLDIWDDEAWGEELQGEDERNLKPQEEPAENRGEVTEQTIDWKLQGEDEWNFETQNPDTYVEHARDANAAHEVQEDAWNFDVQDAEAFSEEPVHSARTDAAGKMWDEGHQSEAWSTEQPGELHGEVPVPIEHGDYEQAWGEELRDDGDQGELPAQLNQADETDHAWDKEIQGGEWSVGQVDRVQEVLDYEMPSTAPQDEVHVLVGQAGETEQAWDEVLQDEAWGTDQVQEAPGRDLMPIGQVDETEQAWGNEFEGDTWNYGVSSTETQGALLVPASQADEVLQGSDEPQGDERWKFETAVPRGEGSAQTYQPAKTESEDTWDEEPQVETEWSYDAPAPKTQVEMATQDHAQVDGQNPRNESQIPDKAWSEEPQGEDVRSFKAQDPNMEEEATQVIQQTEDEAEEAWDTQFQGEDAWNDGTPEASQAPVSTHNKAENQPTHTWDDQLEGEDAWNFETQELGPQGEEPQGNAWNYEDQGTKKQGQVPEKDDSVAVQVPAAQGSIVLGSDVEADAWGLDEMRDQPQAEKSAAEQSAVELQQDMRFDAPPEEQPPSDEPADAWDEWDVEWDGKDDVPPAPTLPADKVQAQPVSNARQDDWADDWDKADDAWNWDDSAADDWETGVSRADGSGLAVSQRAVAVANEFETMAQSCISAQQRESTVGRTVAHAHASSLSESLKLYRALMPLAHYKTLENVPALCMLFVNDCVFLAHIARKRLELNVSLEQEAVALGELGTQWFRAQVSNQIVVLQESLQEADGFAHAVDGRQYVRQERAIQQVLHVLRHLHSVWAPIMPPRTLLRTMGELVDVVFAKVISMIKALENIGEKESEHLAALCRMLSQGTEQMLESTVNSAEGIGAALVVPTWFKFMYLPEILTASLRDLEYLLFDPDSGGALEDYTKGEIVALVRALFADTPHRQRLLGRIG